DEPQIRRTYNRMLHARHDIVEASDGREALAILNTGESFDVILCDLVMPDMDGMSLFREMQGRWPELSRRVIFCTAGAKAPAAEEFLCSLSNPCLHKPISRDTLLRTIAQLL
ncbi:MAG: response regulator, partial [Myxococcota bacterium]